MTKNNRKGFTIIEVVLVLAIAGLIFLMVFIALPALQRSQRNTRRRQDLSRINSAFTDYLAANNHLPTYVDGSTLKIDTDFITRYIDNDCSGVLSDVRVGSTTHVPSVSYSTCGDQFSDPDGTPYILYYQYDVKQTPNTIWNYDIAFSADGNRHVIHVYTHAKCNPDNEESVLSSAGVNDFALRYLLEGNSVYCTDNQ